MKLCSIIITWDDTYILLQRCIENHLQFSDKVIVVYSDRSNYGETIYLDFIFINNKDVIYINWEPEISLSASDNEMKKRNIGLHAARINGFTHFIMADADEFYIPSEVNHIKNNWNENWEGLVCKSQVYVKSPFLTIGLDTTLVPFIHKITTELNFTWNKNYPFAWSEDKKKLLIDPTRQLNINSDVEMCDIIMHHYSWVRSDYNLKIRNSSARTNLQRSSILSDLRQAKEGYFCEFYQKTLVRADVDFGIPEISAINE